MKFNISEEDLRARELGWIVLNLKADLNATYRTNYLAQTIKKL